MAILLNGVLASGVDLSHIDRTVRKEPSYQSQPSYCLMVFGPEAKTRVWLVQDGDRIYVDRNGDGDLTQSGEKLTPSKREEFTTQVDNKPAPYRTWTYSIGTIEPADKTGPHTELKLTRYQIGPEPANQIISLKVNGKTLQYAGWAPIFSTNRSAANVLHFGGPVIVQPLRSKEISLSSKQPELHLRFATPGFGKQSFASLGYEAVPGNIQPIAIVEWPTKQGGASVEPSQVILASRC